STPWKQERAILCYTSVISFLSRHANYHRVPDQITFRELKEEAYSSSLSTRLVLVRIPLFLLIDAQLKLHLFRDKFSHPKNTKKSKNTISNKYKSPDSMEKENVNQLEAMSLASREIELSQLLKKFD
ncbi:hypothetical protein HAX54_038417, partial [Datura stramonium]|nr:hypothetical protein [Datura stramonium]